MKRKISVIELFAGAGLFSLAFKKARFDVAMAVEIDPLASKTYRENLGSHIVQSDVRSVSPSGRSDVLLAGPPCQGFSSLGKRNPNDLRNKLTLEIPKWAKILKPSVVVVENVAPFLHSKEWSVMTNRLQNGGYEITAFILDALEFGVPQRRKRSFTIASKIGLPSAPTHKGESKKTVREAIEGLSLRPDGVNNHYAPKPSRIAIERIKLIPHGGDKREILKLAPNLCPKSWWNYGNRIQDTWGRLHWDKPSNVLRTTFQNASKGRHLHPSQNRVISLREAARLHSIPDSWTFYGSPAQIARQIGNSVPPNLGYAVASCVRELFM